MTKKRSLDIVMFGLLMFLMAYPKTGVIIHELLGLAMMFCFILHHVWNWNWYRFIFRGSYHKFRLAYLIIDMLLLMVVLLLMLSGLTMSKFLPFLNVMTTGMARSLHMMTSYWGFLLMAVHLGLHIHGMLMPLKNKMNDRSIWLQRFVMFVLPYGLSIYGALMLIRHQLIAYLFHLQEFVYFDESIGIVRFLIQYFSIFVLFICLSYHILHLGKQSKQ